MGAPVQMPQSPLAAGEKLYCVSYAPFRSSQNPLDPATRISAAQIDEDLSRLAQVTNCIRTYSVEHGLDQIPEIARRHGLKVIHGLWLSREAEKNRQEIATSIALANRHPDVITAIVVGNEVLLRGEISSSDLANIIRGVKAQVSVPVTYADVWEFWLRHRELYDAVDFVTIHILPYWEDFPIPAAQASAHVDAIRRKVAAAFTSKDILIGEVGWPSAGRMREGALPSPVDQARVLHDVLTLAKRDNFRVNVIEAFDQPWKRYLEGTVGGYWGHQRRANAPIEIRLGRAALQSSVLALAGCWAACLVRGFNFYRCGPSATRFHARRLALARRRRQRNDRRNFARPHNRESAKRESWACRLGALARFGCNGGCGTPRGLGRADARIADPKFRAGARAFR